MPFHNSICKLTHFLFMPKLVQVGCMITASKSLVCMIMLGNQITKLITIYNFIRVSSLRKSKILNAGALLVSFFIFSPSALD